MTDLEPTGYSFTGPTVIASECNIEGFGPIPVGPTSAAGPISARTTSVVEVELRTQGP